MAGRIRFALVAGVLLAMGAVAARPGFRRRHAATAARASAPSLALPALALASVVTGAVTRIELTRPDDDDATRSVTVVIEKTQTGWRLTAPLRTAASADKVDALLANLQDLSVWKQLDAGDSFYDRYDLIPPKALHVVVWTGSGPSLAQVLDFYAGQSSEQGQLVRVPGKQGLFALVNWGPHGYQGFLYTRDLRSWRDPGIFAFDAHDVSGVEIANPHGLAVFTRNGVGWTGTMAPRRRDGTVGPPGKAWRDFDGARVEEMLQAYHALAADDFGDAGQRSSAGVEQAERTGGVITIHLGAALRSLSLRVGGPATSHSRFAIPGSRWAVKEGPDRDEDTLYALSPWTARWAVGDARLFEHAR